MGAEERDNEPLEGLEEGLEELSESFQRGLDADERVGSGVPGHQRADDLGFIRMSGLSRPDEEDEEAGGMPSLDDLDPNGPLSFYEKGVADVDFEMEPQSDRDAATDETDIVPDDTASSPIAGLKDIIADLAAGRGGSASEECPDASFVTGDDVDVEALAAAILAESGSMPASPHEEDGPSSEAPVAQAGDEEGQTEAGGQDETPAPAAPQGTPDAGAQEPSAVSEDEAAREREELANLGDEIDFDALVAAAREERKPEAQPEPEALDIDSLIAEELESPAAETPEPTDDFVEDVPAMPEAPAESADVDPGVLGAGVAGALPLVDADEQEATLPSVEQVAREEGAEQELAENETAVPSDTGNAPCQQPPMDAADPVTEAVREAEDLVEALQAQPREGVGETEPPEPAETVPAREAPEQEAAPALSAAEEPLEPEEFAEAAPASADRFGEEADASVYTRARSAEARRRVSGSRRRSRRLARLLLTLALVAALLMVALQAAHYGRAYLAAPETQFQRASTLAGQGELEQAAAAYETFARRFPNHPLAGDARFQAGFLLQRAAPGRDNGSALLARARDQFRRFLEENPAHHKVARAEGLLGLVHFRMGEYREAVETLHGAELRLRDSSLALPAMRALARSWVELGDYAAAESAYLQALSMRENYDPDTDYEELGALYQMMAEQAANPSERQRLLARAARQWENAVRVPGIDPATRGRLEGRLNRQGTALRGDGEDASAHRGATRHDALPPVLDPRTETDPSKGEPAPDAPETAGQTAQ